MERADVVVLEVDLDEGLPVVVALVQLHLVEHVAVEVQVGLRAEVREIDGDVAAVVLEHHAIPATRLVAVEVQAGVVGKVRRAHELALQVVGPAVQRTHNVAVGVAATAQHQRLSVPADVGDQLDALGGAHQRAAFTLMLQGVVVADLRHRQFMPEVARTMLEDELHLATEQIVVEIAGDRELRAAAFERFETDAQVGHDPQDLQKPMSARPGITKGPCVIRGRKRTNPASKGSSQRGRGLYPRGSGLAYHRPAPGGTPLKRATAGWFLAGPG